MISKLYEMSEISTRKLSENVQNFQKKLSTPVKNVEFSKLSKMSKISFLHDFLLLPNHTRPRFRVYKPVLFLSQSFVLSLTKTKVDFSLRVFGREKNEEERIDEKRNIGRFLEIYLRLKFSFSASVYIRKFPTVGP